MRATDPMTTTKFSAQTPPQAINSAKRSRKQQRLLARYGPWALVTGASSGIGREIALLLAQAGFNLVLVARREELLNDLAEAMAHQHHIEVRVIPADLADSAAVSKIMQFTQTIDIGLLIAAAGFGTSGTFATSSLEEEINMLNVNCLALMALTQQFGQRFIKRGRGGMVLLSSIVAFQGNPNAAHYSATKAYVQALAEALYVEMAPLGVDVLAAAPGPTNSGFADRAGMTMGAALSPADVAQPILNALGRRPTVLPGFLSKLITYSLIPLPRALRVRIMGMVMSGMVQH